MLPNWLQVIAQINPLTYEVDTLRGLMVVGLSSTYGIGLDLLVLFVGMVIVVNIGSKLSKNRGKVS